MTARGRLATVLAGLLAGHARGSGRWEGRGAAARRRPSPASARLLLALAIIAVQPAVARAVQPAATPDFAAIDSYVEREMRAIRLPGLALGIVKGDRVVHLAGFGVADLAGRPVTPQTPFHLASLGKSFTALAIMQLVEAGRVELDAPARRYLPWFRVADEPASARITVRHLLAQTSGIPGAASGAISQRQHTGADAIEQNVRALAVAALRPAGARAGPSEPTLA